MTMKIPASRPLIKQAFLGLLLFGLFGNCGCQSRSEREYKEAQANISNKDFRAALVKLENVLQVSPEETVALQAAREGARVAFLESKEFQKAIRFNEHLVLYSQDPSEVIQAQRSIVLIYLEHLNDYEKSIIEIGKLLSVETDPAAKVELRKKLARSYYHLKRFFQALAEIDEALKSKEGKEQEFDLLLLKANVLTADKKFPEAVELLKGLLEKNRALAIKENVPMTLAVCFEEMKDFGSALELLEKIRPEYPVPEYVDLRIKRLQDRAKNQPKAKLKDPSLKKEAKK